jgi:hypothetical protein
MQALIADQAVQKYPYSFDQLRMDNPQTSFPSNLSAELLEQWGVHPIKPTKRPDVAHTKYVTEGPPQRQRVRHADGTFVADDSETAQNESWEWVQTWIVSDLSPDEIERLQADLAEQVRQQRADAYRQEADPLFFKSQRGEATHQEWLDKVAEIQARFPV